MIGKEPVPSKPKRTKKKYIKRTFPSRGVDWDKIKREKGRER
jgi:hypothetical protein|tara:strand:- start:7276 stop:7401 length:126 start_codon:yes stop_codon:yes gene_type:complete